jgi:GDP-L-fucose synthase
MEQTAKIYIAGHRGMVGSGLERKLRKEGYNNIVTRTSSELDLRNQQAVNDFFEKEKPAYVILAAAKVGGIHANNTYRAEFIYDNLMIEANIIHAAYLNKVTKLLFLGSSCIYPKMSPQPMKEEYLLSGYLESTNQPYAVAKIAGIKLCESYNRQYGMDYRSVMPTNLYGTGDYYHSENSHVIPALIRRFHEAKINHIPEVVIWGSGSSMREFLYVDDMAAASVYVMNLDKSIYDQHTEPMLSHINVGFGSDVTIKQLAQTISEVLGYQGRISFDVTKPDGPARKLMDSGRLNSLGWHAKINFKEGLSMAYQDYLSNIQTLRK